MPQLDLATGMDNDAGHGSLLQVFPNGACLSKAPSDEHVQRVSLPAVKVQPQ